MSITAQQLAEAFDCKVVGDQEVAVSSVASLEHAKPGQITFYTNHQKLYREALAATQASVVILKPDDQEDCPVTALVSDNPYATYAQIAATLHPNTMNAPGIHATAVIAPNVVVPDSASIGPHVVIENGVTLGEHVSIGPGCIVQADCDLADAVVLIANVTLCRKVRVGARTVVHPGAVIGSDGFGNAHTASGWIKVPQLGGVVLGDDVEVGANTTIDCGVIDDTVIENGVRLDNQIQIAHNCHIGEHTAIAACAAMAGSTRIGKRCMIAGDAGFTGHLEVADDVVVLGRTLVTHSINKSGTYMGSFPADEVKTWRRNVVRFRKLDDMAKRLHALERQVGDKENATD